MPSRVTHRDGGMENHESLAPIDALIAELDLDDPEHPDISVGYENGWSLSAFPRGLLIFEDVEADEPRHRYCADRVELRGNLRFSVDPASHWRIAIYLTR